jgi:hypothetical protein
MDDRAAIQQKLGTRGSVEASESPAPGPKRIRRFGRWACILVFVAWLASTQCNLKSVGPRAALLVSEGFVHVDWVVSGSASNPIQAAGQGWSVTLNDHQFPIWSRTRLGLSLPHLTGRLGHGSASVPFWFLLALAVFFAAARRKALSATPPTARSRLRRMVVASASVWVLALNWVVLKGLLMSVELGRLELIMQSDFVTAHWHSAQSAGRAASLTVKNAANETVLLPQFTAIEGRGISLGLPIWLLIAYCLGAFLIAWRRRPLKQNVCRKCGYDLTGNVSGRCSECGEWVRATERSD